MKLFISLFLISSALMANQVVIYSTNGEEAIEAVRERLVGKYEIPKSLISAYLVEECPRTLNKGRRALYFCANKKRLEVLNSSLSDIESIIESLAVFRNEV